MSHPGLSPGGAAGDVQIKSGVQTAVHTTNREVGANMGETKQGGPRDPIPSLQLSSKHKTTLKWES